MGFLTNQGPASFVATGTDGNHTVYILRRPGHEDSYHLEDGTPVHREFKGSYFYSPGPGLRMALRSDDPNAP